MPPKAKKARPSGGRVPEPERAVGVTPKKQEAAANNHATFIGVYNYKGGAMKSTSAREMAAALAVLGKKVAIVDADAQCNLTSFFLGSQLAGQQEEDEDGVPFLTPDEEEEEEDDEETVTEEPEAPPGPRVLQDDLWPDAQPTGLNLRVDNDSPSLHSFLRPIFVDSNVAAFQDSPVILRRIPERFKPVPLNPLPQGQEPPAGELWLLPGSVRIVEFEKQLEQAGNLAQASWIGAFRALYNKMAAEYDLDYIIVDSGPSSGVFNKHAVTACHKILPSCLPDYFNTSSLDGMLRYVLPRWLEYLHNTVMPATNNNADPSFRMGAVPRLFPVIAQNYKTRSIWHNGQYISCVLPQPSTWIQDLRVLFSDPTLPQEVRNMMEPEIVLEGGVETQRYMVWAFMSNIESILGFSAADRCPITWLADFKKFKHMHAQPSISHNLLNQAGRIRARWVSLAKWIIAQTAPAPQQQPNPPAAP